jgi:hypothetical protein
MGMNYMPPAAPAERVRLYAGLDLRRSKRTYRAVRLMIFGQDYEGQPYREKMSTVNLSLFGCCYQSWHNSQIGAKVELHLTEGLLERSALVHARVRHVRPPVSHSELFQIGVEFDSPQTEWLGAQEETTVGTASHVVPAREQEKTATKPETNFPAAPPLELSETERAVVERVATTIDRLSAALQGPAQRAANSAVEAIRSELEATLKQSIQREVAAQLDEAVRQALWMIGEISSANARKAESLLQQRLEQMLRCSEEGVFRRVEARFEELRSRWEEQQEEQCRPVPAENEPAAMRESSTQLQACVIEAGAVLHSMASDTLEQFRRQLDSQTDSAMSEAKQRWCSSLTALEAENLTACDARRRLFEDDLARATERAAEQFRSGIKAHLYSSLAAAIEAVDKHANTALAMLLRRPG